MEAALLRLREARLLDDAGLAARYARSRLAGHGLGRRRIREALRQRGVSKAVVEAGLGAALAEVPEAEVLDGLARKYWRQRGRDAPPRRLTKLAAFLLRRGFPPPLVRERLSALWPRWREVLAGLDLEPLEPGEETTRSGEDG